MPSCILTWVSLAAQAASGAAPVQSQPWGLPPGHSTIAPDVDFLYTLILWITGIVFIGVEGLIIYFCIRYRRRPGGKPGYTHGNNTAEIIWTVSPALVLVAIALLQMPAWSKAKMSPPKSTDPDVITIQTFAQYFQWNFRYPGKDGKYESDDSVYVNKRFWLPIGSTALMPLRSIDVIHSFFLFQMRVKQDVVPGLRNAVWFQPTGFYVAKIDPNASIFDADYQKHFKPKDYHRKKEWDFVTSEDAFQAKYGANVVAIDGFEYQDGLMRVRIPDARATVIQNNQIRKGAGWKEAEFCIVPFQGTCAELCGYNHFTMTFDMYVVPRKAYEFWLSNDDYWRENQVQLVLDLWSHWKN